MAWACGTHGPGHRPDQPSHDGHGRRDPAERGAGERGGGLLSRATAAWYRRRGASPHAIH
jgi:hypothetical protein